MSRPPMIKFRTPDEVELDALRHEVRILLEHCNEEQKANFAKFYVDIDKMTREQLRSAIGLCQRTITKDYEG